LATHLASAVSNFTQGFKDGISDNLKWLLQANPNDQWSAIHLQNVLCNGAFIRNPIGEALMSATNVENVENSYATAINGLLISLAWKQDVNASPAIIVMDGTGLDDNPSASHMNTDKLRNVKMEYRGKTFWLVHAMQKWNSQSDWAWELLGYDALPLEGSPWGFSWQDAVKSSYGTAFPSSCCLGCRKLTGGDQMHGRRTITSTHIPPTLSSRVSEMEVQQSRTSSRTRLALRHQAF
jgi:hypothetical protein